MSEECKSCGSKSDVYTSKLCLGCGKSMAEKKERCAEAGCGSLLTKLTKEINVRPWCPGDKFYFPAAFRNGPPPNLNSGEIWRFGKQSEDEITLENDAGNLKYKGHTINASEKDKTNYFLLVPTNGEFMAVPADIWYQFNKVNPQGEQLSLEQAEQKMRDRERKVKRIQKRMMRGSSSTEGGDHKDDEDHSKGEDWDYQRQFSDDAADMAETVEQSSSVI